MADIPEPVVPVADLVPVIAALNGKGEKIEELADAVRDGDRRAGHRTVAVLLTVGVLVVVVVAFGVYAALRSQASADRARANADLIRTLQAQNASIQAQLRLAQQTSDAIAAATSPQATARSAETLRRAIAQIEHCDASHTDHDVNGTPLDPACPP